MSKFKKVSKQPLNTTNKQKVEYNVKKVWHSQLTIMMLGHPKC